MTTEERALLEAFVVDNHDLERLEALLAEFNIFEAVRQELRHSDFLAFLLDPAQTTAWATNSSSGCSSASSSTPTTHRSAPSRSTSPTCARPPSAASGRTLTSSSTTPPTVSSALSRTRSTAASIPTNSATTGRSSPASSPPTVPCSSFSLRRATRLLTKRTFPSVIA